MTAQDSIDAREAEAIARYVALRTTFGECWAAPVPVRRVRVRKRVRRQGWADWMPVVSLDG